MLKQRGTAFQLVRHLSRRWLGLLLSQINAFVYITISSPVGAAVHALP